MNDLIVTMTDVRRAGMCVRGAKRWCAVHDIDFKKFLRDGVPASTLEKIGDPLVMRAVRSAREAAQRKV